MSIDSSVMLSIARLVLPDFAGVVLGPGDDGVALVVEGAGKYFVSVAFKRLDFLTEVSVPYARGFISARGDYFGGLRVELHLAHFAEMAG